MNYEAVLKEFTQLLTTQSDKIPPEAWDTLPQLDAALAATTDLEALAETVKLWSKPYPNLFKRLRDQQLISDKYNLPDDDEEDNSAGADDAGIVTNETLRYAIQQAQQQRQNLN